MQKASHIQATPKVRQATETSMSCTGKSTSSRADRAKPQIPACVGSKDVLGVQCCMMPSHQKQRQHVRMSLVDIGSSCPLFEHVCIYIYTQYMYITYLYNETLFMIQVTTQLLQYPMFGPRFPVMLPMSNGPSIST